MQDSDGDSSEEEVLVYLSFDSILDSELLQPETPFKLIGLEEDQPILQLGSQVSFSVFCSVLLVKLG